MSKTRKFKIEFSKQGSKWESGFLIQSFHDGKAWIWLKNCDKVTIRKGSVSESFIAKLAAGESLTCAGYNIHILCENEVPPAPRKVPSPVPKVESSISTVEAPVNSSSIQIASDTSVLPAQPQKAFLDPVLLRSMRSYQIEAAAFLLNRLTDGPHGMSTAPPVSCSSRHPAATDLPLTGAILADDMVGLDWLTHCHSLTITCLHSLNIICLLQYHSLAHNHSFLSLVRERARLWWG